MEWKPDIPHNEEKVKQTIAAAQSAFYEGEIQGQLSHWEFLLQQSRYIQKSWWALQGLLLLGVLYILKAAESGYTIQRSLGVAAPLFVILTLPEFWKNQSCNAMEIEAAAFYSLRHIYSARLTLFAGVDVLMLSFFFLGTSATGRVTVWEMLIQFVLPFTVTCCICFRCLYSTRNRSVLFAVLLCTLWTGLWMQIVLLETVYDAVSIPVWCLLLSGSVCYLIGCIFHGQRKMGQIWEVKPVWN